MIPKISSDELNNVMNDAKKELDGINKKLELAKTNIEDKLKIINYESEYVQHMLNKVKNGSYEKINGMKALSSLDKSTSGKFDSYRSDERRVGKECVSAW